jgi:3-dehydroquinate dehydratase-1
LKSILTVSESDLLTTIDTIPDVYEIRLDLFSSQSLNNKIIDQLFSFNRELIFTYRLSSDSSIKEKFNSKPEDISRFLEFFRNKGFFIDIELDKENSYIQEYLKPYFRKIYSIHNFEKTLSISEMKSLVPKNLDQDSYIKFASIVNSYQELYQFLLDTESIGPTISIGMGALGVYSRVLGDRFGSLASYTCLGEPKAPGQIELKKWYEIREKTIHIKKPRDYNEFLSQIQELNELLK